MKEREREGRTSCARRGASKSGKVEKYRVAEKSIGDRDETRSHRTMEEVGKGFDGGCEERSVGDTGPINLLPSHLSMTHPVR